MIKMAGLQLCKVREVLKNVLLMFKLYSFIKNPHMYQNLHNPQDQCVSSETKSYLFINYLMLYNINLDYCHLIGRVRVT